MNIYRVSADSPIGQLCIEASERGVTKISRIKSPTLLSIVPNEHTEAAQSQLKEYFKGKRKEFDISIDTDGYSAFYQKVWDALLTIPYGQTQSYLDIAKKLGDTNAVRAVGLANGKNPVGIVIPCHRVIGSNGRMVGYAGGLDMKKWLLRHELSFTPTPAHLLF